MSCMPYNLMGDQVNGPHIGNKGCATSLTLMQFVSVSYAKGVFHAYIDLTVYSYIGSYTQKYIPLIRRE